MNKFPLEIHDVEPDTAAFRNSLTDADYGGFVRVGPKGYFFPKAFENEIENLYNTEPKPGQVIITGHPRSGTTLTQQIMWLILNDLNYEENEKSDMSKAYEFIDVKLILPKSAKNETNNAAIVALTQRKMKYDNSYIKTHLPLSLLPPMFLEKTKIVYVARDPKDTIVSYYNYTKGILWPFNSDFKAFWDVFKNGLMTYGPYFDGVKEAWELRHHPNLLFLFYEDIVHNRLNTIRRIADFLDKKYTDEQLLGLCEYVEFDNLKKKNTCETSIVFQPGYTKSRKGIVGGWRDYFDEEMILEADQWIAENLHGTDLQYPTIILS